MRHKGLKLEILSSILFPVYQLGGESTQSKNMCDIVLEKLKGCGGTVDRMRD